jgi:hypothetical protein
MDPPAIITAHGLHWFPVWKGSYILCGSWWRAMGWMLEKQSSVLRTLIRFATLGLQDWSWLRRQRLKPPDGLCH